MQLFSFSVDQSIQIGAEKYPACVMAKEGVMINQELTASVERLASTIINLSDAKLDTPWHWKGHDEGVRFALFVTLLELRQLTVKLAAERSAGLKLPPITNAQRILAQYHSAFLDLQASIAGLTPKKATQLPSKKEWSVQLIYSHILETELSFTAVIRYALENHSAGKWLPVPIPEKEYPRLYRMKEKTFSRLMKTTLKNMVAYHKEFHTKILYEFAGINNDELTLPATFWEETRFHIGYRLHRFEAHSRQHTIQIDKTLNLIGCGPTEAKRIVRMLYSALAELNGNLIAPSEKKNQESIELARTIDSRTKDLSKLIK
jgi:hypothetical protein